ncbi:unnamed protein product [Chrysoparadoxa australica]
MQVALVAPRKPLEIVTNTASKRKTEVCINFDRGERNFGSDAYALMSRKPHQTFTRMNAMLGRSEEHPAMQAMADARVPTQAFYNETRGGLNLRLNDGGHESVFTPEELMAMMLAHAKDITANFGHKVKDAVVTVPQFYTAMERQALLDAAKLADLTVLQLLDENTAAALHFATSHTYDEPHTILYYNMGASSTQVSIITYSPKKVKGNNVGQITVRGKGWDSHLGGYWFDLRLVDILADEFNKKWGKGDVREHPRPMAKLGARARKLKEVLSANNEMPITVQSLHDDVDFTTTVTRSHFEQASADLFAKVTKPVEDALAAAGMTLADIDSVEIIGGGVRIPKVQEKLRRFFKATTKLEPLELGVHLNGDESMALGAAFSGANISRAFQVREVGMSDITPFAVNVTMVEIPSEAESKGGLGGLFGGGGKKGKEAAEEAEEGLYHKQFSLQEAGSPSQFRKTFTFTRDTDLQLNITYAEREQNPQLPEGTELLISHYDVTGVAVFAEKMAKEERGTPKVALRFGSDIGGIPVLKSAEAYVEYEKEETYVELVEVDDEEPKKEVGDAADGEAAPAAEEDSGEKVEEAEEAPVADAGEAKEEGEGEKKGEAEAEAADGEKKDAKKKKKPKKKRKKKVSVEKTRTVTAKIKETLAVTRQLGPHMSVRPMNEEEKAHAAEQLSRLNKKDRDRKAKEEAKNDLEGFILSVRSSFYDQEAVMEQVTSEGQRAALLDAANGMEDWLYDDGYDEEASVYKAKRAELAALNDPIMLRIEELESRPLAVQASRHFIAKVRESVAKWAETKPHITESERDDVTAKLDKAEQWLNTKEAEQAALAGHEAPAFLSTDVEPELKGLKALVSKLAKKQPPPPPKEEEPDVVPKEGGEGEEAAGEGEGSNGEAEGEAEAKTEPEADGEDEL